ncbi:MAG: M48 family metalloprotease [Opitutales bacterium]
MAPVGGARRRPLLAAVIALAFWAPALPAVDLPDLGTSADRVMSPADEARIGAEFFRSLRQHVDLVEDPELQAYIRNLGYRLAAHSGASTDFRFFIVRDPRINAFAAPGGYVGFNAGLILEARHESELAGVVAHEIAHVSQRHIARSSEAADDMSLPMAASIIAAVLLGGQDPELGQAALAATMAGGTQYRIDFTRANEAEADRVGIEMLAAAGFDPEGMPDFFERLQARDRLGAPVVPEFLRTHPVTLSRIADSRNRAAGYSVESDEDHGDFHHARAKLRILLNDDPSELVDHFEEAVADHDGAAWARYGLALARAEAGETERAAEELAELRSDHPERLAYRIAEARIQRLAGEPAAAAETYRAALELYPGNAGLVRYLADTLLEQGEADEARTLLRDHVRRHDGAPAFHRLLARAEGSADNGARRNAALAEYHFRTGRTPEAIRLLRKALDTTESKTLIQRWEARMEEYERRAAEQPPDDDEDDLSPSD